MAAQYFKGTLTPSPLVRGASGDTFGTHHSVLGCGGFMEVKTIAERNLIPTDAVNGVYFDQISTGQRRLGMLVYVYEDSSIYQLQSPVIESVWMTKTPTQKYNYLADNNNWVLFTNFSSQMWGGERIWKEFSQVLHGFVPGDVIGYDIDLSAFIKSSSINATIIEPLGIVSEVNNINNFNLTFSGYIDTEIYDKNGDPLIGGELYYLSSTAGKLTNIQPTGSTEVSKPMLVTLSVGYNSVVLQYNAFKKTDVGVTYIEFLNYSGETQNFLEKTVTGATNIGFFGGKTGIQLVKIDFTPTTEGNYYSLYNYYYRDNMGVIRIGTPPSDGLKRRGYLKSGGLKSWLWNEYTGSGNQLGWIVVDGNISTSVGSSLTGYPYTSTPYSGVTWTEGVFYNNGGNLVLQVSGDTTTGTTFSNEGPIYSDKVNYNLELRTLQSKDESTLKISYDNNFVYLSANTSNSTVTGGNILNSITTSEKTYNVLPTDQFIAVRTVVNLSDLFPGGYNIFLPTVPENGREIIVADIGGYSGEHYSAKIHVWGGTKMILNWSEATIDTNYGSVTLVYNDTFWSVTAFSSAPSYS